MTDTCTLCGGTKDKPRIVFDRRTREYLPCITGWHSSPTEILFRANERAIEYLSAPRVRSKSEQERLDKMMADMLITARDLADEVMKADAARNERAMRLAREQGRRIAEMVAPIREMEAEVFRRQ